MNTEPREIATDALVQAQAEGTAEADEYADAILSALEEHGYVVVPREPTDAMVEAAIKAEGAFKWDGKSEFAGPFMRATIAAALEASREQPREPEQ